MSETPRFDADYYQRFYLNPETRIYDRARHARLVAGVVNLVEWFSGPLQRVLDVGAGVGWWRDWLERHRKNVEYVGTELEASTCEHYGHRQADLTTLRLPTTFDLVVCQGVLPYLDEAGALAAIENLAALCDGYLYLEAITGEDLRKAVDRSRTDLRVKPRSGAWYRRALKPHFREVGGGLFASRENAIVFYALEAPPDRR